MQPLVLNICAPGVNSSGAPFASSLALVALLPLLWGCASTPEPEVVESPPETTEVDLCWVEWTVEPVSGQPVSQVVCEPKTAYFETIEVSPNVQSVTRVTGFAEAQGQIGGGVISRDDHLYYWYIEERGAPQQRVNLWRSPLVGAGRTRVTNGPGLDIDPSVSSGGTAMVFASDRIGGRSSLWRINTAGGAGLTRVTSELAADYAPSLSPDEAWIAFERWLPNVTRPQIWTVDLSTSLATQLTEGHRPRISPDGRSILYNLQNRDTGRFEVWQMNVNGGAVTLLSLGGSHDEVQPSWSPDGNAIVYASNEGVDGVGQNNFDIWVMSLDRGTRTQLTTNGSHDDEPIWHADGRIFFRSNRGGSWNIWYIQTLGVVN